MRVLILYQDTTWIALHAVESIRLSALGLHVKTFGNEEVLHKNVIFFRCEND